jgi:hypothetical protein
VVEDLIDRVMVDPRLNANPRVDEAHHKVPSAGFKYLVTEMLCWAAGRPQRYSATVAHSHGFRFLAWRHAPFVLRATVNSSRAAEP